MTDDGPANNAAPATNAAAAVVSLASPAAASSLSGRKRTADTRDSATSAAACDAVSAASSSSSPLQHPDASDPSQNKKQRGGSSSEGNSVPAAASSVGFESVAASSAESAASLTGVSGALSGRGKSAMQQSRCSGPANQDKDATSGSAAAASASSATAQPAAGSSEVELQSICIKAQKLIRGVLSFAELEVHRWDPARATEVRRKMQELAEAEAELRSIPAESTDEQANQRVVKQAQIEELSGWLKANGGFPHDALRLIHNARVAAEGPADCRAIRQLGFLCSFFVAAEQSLAPQPAYQQTVLRSWLLCVDALLSRLRSVVPRIQLTLQQCQVVLQAALSSGALPLIPVLMQAHAGTAFPTALLSSEPFLTHCCLTPHLHHLSVEPYLRLFEFGLDPTLIREGGNPLSALQLARNFVRDHGPSVPSFHGPLASMHAAVVNAESKSLPSVLLDQAFQFCEWNDDAELGRRRTLHTRFMHALIPAWFAHSTKVRCLLLEAAPTRLIPPLVDIIARYLDLEGLPPERTAYPIKDEAEDL